MLPLRRFVVSNNIIMFALSKFLIAALVLLGVSACDNNSSRSLTADFVSPQAQGASSSVADVVTWHQHIAPLVSQKCAACHVEGGIAPFSVDDPLVVTARAAHMALAIDSGAMPPWGAQETDECTPPAPFKGDLSLSDAEKGLFRSWVDQDMPLGDPQTAADIPEPVRTTVASPQRQLTMPSPIEVSSGDDRFVCYRLEVNNEQKVWLTSSQIIPGNTTIAHHALVFADPHNESAELAADDGTYDCFGGPGLTNPQLVAVWAPGIGANEMPADTGMPLEPNSALVVQMHYHPAHHNAGVEVDSATRFDMAWREDAPAYVGAIFLVGNLDVVNDEVFGGEGFGLTTGPEFMIPAGAENHTEINRMRLPFPSEGFEDLPVSIWQVATHMHFVGRDMKITLNEGENDEQCLVQTPRWDYRWQRLYFYDKPITEMPAMNLTDTLTLRCTYNNSMSNPFVVEALHEQGLNEPVDVYLGDETLDEMCIAALGLAVPSEYGEILGL